MKNNNGFTIVELLVVIAIIGLLISLLLPAIQASREYARRSHCANNMKQIALAMNAYHDTLKSLPPGNLVKVLTPEDDKLPEGACHPGAQIYCGSIGWPAFILAQLEQPNLYEKVDFDVLAYTPVTGEGTNHDAASLHGNSLNSFVSQNMPPVFSCPSAIRQSSCHKDYSINGRAEYPECVKNDALFFFNSGTRFSDVKDGLSNTFLVLEKTHYTKWIDEDDKDDKERVTTFGVNPFFWVNLGGQGYAICAKDGQKLRMNTVYKIRPTRGYVRSDHPKGVNAAMCDGSVHFLDERMDYDLYRALFTHAGKEPVNFP